MPSAAVIWIAIDERGYRLHFNPRYLGYEAAEGIDWVWEHRINDLAEFGL